MGGLPHPEAVRAVALAVPATLAAEWGKERWEGLRDEMKATVERQTGKPHEWRQRGLNSDVYELVPVGDE